MAKFPLDLSKFKKVKSDDKSSTLKHPDGHEIKVAHAGLNHKMKKDLREMPTMMADGGEVADEPQMDSSRSPASQQAPIVINVGGQQQQPQRTSPGLGTDGPDMMDAAGNWIGDKFQAAKDWANAQHNQTFPQQQQQVPPPEPEQPRVPANIPASQPADTQSPMQPQQANPMSAVGDAYDQSAKAQLGGLQQQVQGTQEMGKALGEQSKQKAQAIDQAMQRQQDFENNYKEQSSKMLAGLEQAKQAFAEGHINANHYMESKTAGGKVMSAIGLILGGIGSGLAGGENLAVKFLNQQIERDIEAQKADVNKRATLLEANFKQFGDWQTAQNVTRAQMKEFTAMQLEKSAAQSQSPIEAARAKAAAGGFMKEAGTILQGAAQHKALMQMMSGGQSGDTESAFKQKTSAYRFMGRDDLAKQEEEKHVPGVGDASIPVPHDDRARITGALALDKQLKALESFATKHSGTVLDQKTVNEGQALANSAKEAYRTAHAQGVFKESEQKFDEKLIPSDPTAFGASWRTVPKYKETAKINRDVLKGLLGSYGIKTPNIQEGSAIKESAPVR